MGHRSLLLLLLAFPALAPVVVAEAGAEPGWCEGSVDTDCTPGHDPEAWCTAYVNLSTSSTCINPGASGSHCGGAVDAMCEAGSLSCVVWFRTFCLTLGPWGDVLDPRIDAAATATLR